MSLPLLNQATMLLGSVSVFILGNWVAKTRVTTNVMMTIHGRFMEISASRSDPF